MGRNTIASNTTIYMSRTRSHTSFYQATKKEVEHDLEQIIPIDECSQTTTSSNCAQNEKLSYSKQNMFKRHVKVDEENALKGLSLLLDHNKVKSKKSDTIIKIKIPKAKCVQSVKLPVLLELISMKTIRQRGIYFRKQVWNEIGLPKRYLSKCREGSEINLSAKDSLRCPRGKGSIHTALAYMISHEESGNKLPAMQIRIKLA